MGWGLSQAEPAWQEAQFLVQGWVRRLGWLVGWAVAWGVGAAEEPVFPAAVRLGGASGLGWAPGHHTHTLSVSLPPSLPPHLGGPLRALGLSAAEGRGLQG